MAEESPELADEFRAITEQVNTGRLYIPPDPSPRTPDYSTKLNVADQIERQYQQLGHRTWGFVIYRTTYDSDTEWAEVLRRLRFHVEQSFTFYNGMDVYARMAWTVVENREVFDGATAATVREHFCQWALNAPQAEQEPQHRDDDGAAVPVASGRSPRYRSPRYHYCIQVDAAALNSIINIAPAPPDPDFHHKGWVRLINASWNPTARQGNNWGTYDAIEGITDKDIGWIQVPYVSVMDEYYELAAGRNFWPQNYKRPPTIVGYVMM